jgi:hypothetical protein
MIPKGIGCLLLLIAGSAVALIIATGFAIGLWHN